MEYTYLSFCNKLIKNPVLPNEMLSKWKNEERLYVYHGKRDCVKKENKNKVDVFDWFNNDAASNMYPKHQQAYNLNEGIENVKIELRNFINAVDAPDWQVKTLFARNITRDNGDQSNENWKTFLTDADRDSQAEILDFAQLNSALNKRPRFNDH